MPKSLSLLVLLRELPTSCVDVGAAGVTNRRLDTDGRKGTNELVRPLRRRGLELGALKVIELNEVDVCEGPAREVA